MTDQQHPITPPPELVQQWHDDNSHLPTGLFALGIATQAARWGADQELKACCEWLDSCTTQMADMLHATRRPKPLNLKRQALNDLEVYHDIAQMDDISYENIRRALESLPD